ncbi:MAG TPA: type II toxin-antitoxin system RatA family toxin [Rhizomicrobium sp.]|nr:type II toxin-antitoxin system RatA family toxin [Rhizomicrobium sp.]
MPAHSESRIVPYTADLMYSIAADVERYPEFVPWCAALRVLSRGREGDKKILVAETVVGFKALRERYTSRVVLDPGARTIDVTLVEGVFRRLENHWRFTPMGAQSKLDFAIMFEFKSKMLSAIAGSAFSLVISRMTHAFEERAKKLSEQTA